MSDSKQAIVFADVCKSTQLYEQLGDEKAHQIIAHTLTVLEQECTRFDGRMVKTIGDEIMCTFPAANNGVQAAIAMQLAVSRDFQLRDFDVGIRVGLHYGPALDQDDGDIFGDAVNVAARMSGLAKREQIVTTAYTVSQVPENAAVNTRALGKARVRGKLLPVEIVDVIWQEDVSTITVVSTAIQTGDNSNAAKLVLFQNNQKCKEMDTLTPATSLGRDVGNVIVVEAQWISRRHASVEAAGSGFVLKDHSTNATYVTEQGKPEVQVHRDAIPLHGPEGVISLGKSAADQPAENLVRYQVTRGGQ